MLGSVDLPCYSLKKKKKKKKLIQSGIKFRSLILEPSRYVQIVHICQTNKKKKTQVAETAVENNLKIGHKS